MNNPFKSSIVVTCASLVFIVLVVLVMYNYEAPSDSQFSPENFYAGNNGAEVDPKENYEQMVVGLVSGSLSCRSEMSKATDEELVQAGNYTWLAPNKNSINPDGISSYDDIRKLSLGADESVLMPYAEGDHIIAPGKMTFINSNVVQESADYTYIMAYIGTKYVLRWDDVDCWWCHEGKDNKNKHTRVVGARGIYASCIGGYIVGVAKDSTTVTLYEVLEDQSMVPVPFSNLFGEF